MKENDEGEWKLSNQCQLSALVVSNLEVLTNNDWKTGIPIQREDTKPKLYVGLTRENQQEWNNIEEDIGEEARHKGSWTDNEDGIEKVIVEFFDNLFNSSTSRAHIPIIWDISRLVTSEMNRALTREITEEEVKRASFSLNPDKAPNSNGMTSLFFQRFWDVISSDLIDDQIFFSNCK